MSALPIEEITRRYEARPFTEAELPALLELCRGNPLYYAHMGEQLSIEALRADLTALPPGRTIRDKYFFGLYRDGKLAAAMDLIDGHRAPGEAYLGWFIFWKRSCRAAARARASFRRRSPFCGRGACAFSGSPG